MARIRRTSINLDLDLVDEARGILGTDNTTETVHRALAEIGRRERLRSLAAWDLNGMTPEDLERMRAPRFPPEEVERIARGRR